MNELTAEKIISLFGDYPSIIEMEFESDGFKIKIKKEIFNSLKQPEKEKILPKESPPFVQSSIIQLSKFVGTYRSNKTNQEPLIKLNDVVKKGQIISYIEILKVMFGIEAEINGKILRIMAENNQPIEYGQPLFEIQPD